MYEEKEECQALIKRLITIIGELENIDKEIKNQTASEVCRNCLY
jgi:hypothetical protein